MPAGEYFVTLLDTARTVAWFSNTCMDTTANVVFTSPDEIALTADLTEDNLCGGEDVATICYTASGSTGALSTVAVHGLGLELAPDSATCFTNLSCYGGDGGIHNHHHRRAGVLLRHLGGRFLSGPHRV